MKNRNKKIFFLYNYVIITTFFGENPVDYLILLQTEELNSCLAV